MKCIKFLLLALILFPTVQVAAQTLGSPITITTEMFNVPLHMRHKDGTMGTGADRPFTLLKQSKLTLTIFSKNQKPSLNIYLLDDANYSKYQSSGSLTNLTPIDGLSKMNTLGFESSAVLPAGKYYLLIRWAENGLFIKTPEVGLKIIAEEIIQKVQKTAQISTPTPVSFWKKYF